MPDAALARQAKRFGERRLGRGGDELRLHHVLDQHASFYLPAIALPVTA